MSPRTIITRSLEKRLDIIAVSDHNSAENVSAAMQLGKKYGIHVLPGMEICSREEVHILALFDTLTHVMTMQEYIYAHLPGENRPDVFGYQIVANEKDEVLSENPRMLIGATQLDLYKIISKVRSLGGISIAAHVDRPAYSIISQLGFIPPDLPLDAVEVSSRIPCDKAPEKIAGIKNFSCITCSDAHCPDDIGKVWTDFLLTEPTLAEIQLALKGVDARRIEV